ncbi:MAG: thiol-disulfide isomerase [Gammaproteobacteria bacterium]|nr:thiol-disulfide isomerase [Gammaproteobacteria bacterium]|tara:strand:+ start:95 stop:700 length:606 start_codon:yes stop_codon:yes gene_type:complete
MDNYLAEIVILLTLVVLILVIAVFALARQIGDLHKRLATADSVISEARPKVGELAPFLSMVTLNGSPLEFGGPHEAPQLLLFVSPTCPVCEEMVLTAKSMARSERLALIFGSDGGEMQKHTDYVKEMDIEDYPYVLSLELRKKFQVSELPYAVLIDEHGVLRSKGLVNSREHLKRLLESNRSGYPIQDCVVQGELPGEQAL